jgi:membrane protease YdiL (CAAX protease family)
VTGGPSPLTKIFVGPNGLRAGWRLLIFNVAFMIVGVVMKALLVPIVGREPAWTAPYFLLIEAVSLAGAALCVLLMARIERRRFTDYGLGGVRPFGRLFWEGSLWGLATIGTVVGLMALAGGYAVRGLALGGFEIVRSTLLWAVAFLVAGFMEEFVFRGYELATLASGLRFWPAAVVLSALFGFYLHYAQKPNETLVDGLSVSLVALFFCFTVRRTGNLWFAIGWHWTFNLGSMFVFGFPNTGNQGGLPIPGRLLNGVTKGPAALTGGPMGAEASLIIFPVLIVLFAAFARRFRTVRLTAGRPRAGASL